MKAMNLNTKKTLPAIGAIISALIIAFGIYLYMGHDANAGTPAVSKTESSAPLTSVRPMPRPEALARAFRAQQLILENQ